MQEITREQEAAIARLAIDHPSVKVTPQVGGDVLAEAGGRILLIDADGIEAPVPLTSLYVRLPIGIVRELLGAEAVDHALADVQGKSYPDHALGTALSGRLEEALGEMARLVRH